MLSLTIFSSLLLFSGLSMAHPRPSSSQPSSERTFAQFQSYSSTHMVELKKRLIGGTPSSDSSNNLVSLWRRGPDGAVVGAAVGGTLGGLFLMFVALLLVWSLRRRRNAQAISSQETVGPQTPFMADAPELPLRKEPEPPRDVTTQVTTQPPRGTATQSPNEKDPKSSKSSYEIAPKTLQESLQGIPTEYDPTENAPTGLGLYQKKKPEEPLRVELEGSSPELRDYVAPLRPPSRIKTGQRQFIAGFKRTMSFRQS